MVSLIRSEYLSKINDNWKIKTFHEFVNEKNIELNSIATDNSIDDIFLSFVKSVANSNLSVFRIKYLEFSKRKPSEESPWLFDDFLLFVIIIGIIKFKIDKSWILEVVEKRSSKNAEFNQINMTFLNLLNENYNSKDNLFEMIYVFQEVINFPINPIEEFNLLYERLVSDSSFLDTRNDFLKIIRLRAIDIIILKKELPNSQEVTNLKLFKNIFTKRVNFISKIINVLLVTSLILWIYYFQSESKSNQDFINTISTISGILGLGLLVFMNWVSSQIKRLIFAILGYSKIFKGTNEK